MTTAKPIEAVLFDLDDTLIHWAPDDDERPVAALSPYLERLSGEVMARHPGIEVLHDDFVEAVEHTIQAIIQEAIDQMACPPFEDLLRRSLGYFGLSLTRSEAAALTEACQWTLHPRCSLEPNAQRVVTELGQRGLKLGVLSNSLLTGAMRANELDALGLLESFDTVTTSSDAGRFKPHPEVFLFACKCLGSEPGATVMVGDSLRDDARASTAAGLTGVWYAPTGEDSQGLVPTDDDVVIGDLAELLGLLGRGAGSSS